MTTLSNGDKGYRTIINEIETGQVKIPRFQRKFVWDIKSSAKLLDSIIKHYPIGTFIYWRTNEELRAGPSIGNLNLPVQAQGENVNYILDGQQRITSFYAAVHGAVVEKEDGKTEDFSKIYINLESQGDDDIVIIDVEGKAAGSYITLQNLMSNNFTVLAAYPTEKHKLISELRQILEGYTFRGVNLTEADIDTATEVFTRLNVGGKGLTVFEIMVAKTYDSNSNFDLAEKFNALIKDLIPANYETLSSSTILQVVSMLIKRNVTRKVILALPKQVFIQTWDKATSSIKSSVDFLKNFGIPVSKLLPYDALIVTLSYFFSKQETPPTAKQVALLQDFFWRCSLGYRYSSGTENKLAQDADKIDAILAGNTPNYEWSIDISEENIKKVGYFATGRSFIKAILCLYAMKKPKSFNNNLDVRIDNSWLKISTSKNYHHFFPQAYMRKTFPTMEVSHYNHILNITIVDDYLNKRIIRANPPSDYIAKFEITNQDIDQTLATHLIGDKTVFGITNNDYETFFNHRASEVSKELKKRIIEQTTGEQVQVESEEEYENEEVENT